MQPTPDSNFRIKGQRRPTEWELGVITSLVNSRPVEVDHVQPQPSERDCLIIRIPHAINPSETIIRETVTMLVGGLARIDRVHADTAWWHIYVVPEVH